MYVWYILEDIVPNFSDESCIRSRTIYGCVVPMIKRSPFAGAVEASLRVRGTKLFNSMSQSIRNITKCTKEKIQTKSVNVFKLNLFHKFISVCACGGDVF